MYLCEILCMYISIIVTTRNQNIFIFLYTYQMIPKAAVISSVGQFI